MTHKINQHTAEQTNTRTHTKYTSVCVCMYAPKLTCAYLQAHNISIHFTLTYCENYLNCIYDNIFGCNRWQWTMTRERTYQNIQRKRENAGTKHCLAYSDHKYFVYKFHWNIQAIYSFWSELTRLSNHSIVYHHIQLIEFWCSNNAQKNITRLPCCHCYSTNIWIEIIKRSSVILCRCQTTKTR